MRAGREREGPASRDDHFDLKEEVPHILEQISRGEKVDHLETVRVTKDGRRLDVSLMISPITDARGTIVVASTIAHFDKADTNRKTKPRVPTTRFLHREESSESTNARAAKPLTV